MARLHLFKKLKEKLVARLEKWIAALQEKAIELNFELLEAKGFIVLKDIQLKKEIPSTFVSYFLIDLTPLFAWMSVTGKENLKEILPP